MFSFAAIFILTLIIGLIILPIVSYWKLFEKAGKPGWAAIVPIYSTLVLLEIINKPWYWLLLMIIPFFGIIWAVWAINLFVKSFGKDEGYTIGVLFLPFVFLPLMAFDEQTDYLELEPLYEYANTTHDDEYV